jgi:poly(3-hydroxybutyrate) depolymerase
MKDENLLEFDQREFSGIEAGLGDVGYVYVPTACKDSKVMCRLHVALHGCLMYRSNFLHDWITEPIPPFVKIGGFNELAELNNIIVLYPQTRPTIPNPLGCFDAYGYTGPDYGKLCFPDFSVVYSAPAVLYRDRLILVRMCS